MEKKYYLNDNTKKLHIIGGCCHTRYIPQNAKLFSTEDEAIAAETRYMSYCKLCFTLKKRNCNYS